MTLKEKITIPKYSLGEEIMSAVTHGVGALLSIVALVLCVLFSAHNESVVGVVSSIIYGLTLIILYTMSTLYHSLAVNNAKRVFRIIDHCSIYLLIAGTYTPFTLMVLPKPLGYYLFALVFLGIFLYKIHYFLYLLLSLQDIIMIKYIQNQKQILH